jgi:transcriptional regulator with GAF, ATPase, and Fis domain
MIDEMAQLKEQVKELESLNHLAEVLSQTLNVEETLQSIIQCSMQLCKAERAAIVLFSPGSAEEVHTIMRNVSALPESIDHRLNQLVAGCLRRTQKPFVTHDILDSFEYSAPSDRLLNHGAALAVPLISDGNLLGMIHHVRTRGGEPFSDDALRVAEIVARMASQFVVRAKIHETQRDDLERLQITIATEQGIHAILGQSEPMQKVLRDIALVAPTTANVLISGETGTGKELTARAIHAQSLRVAKPFIAINCAAIPADLFESELFGHERGAFTGASSIRKGKFEIADGGTLFLDEISEMPIPLQPKLLRVLEERSFSRVGSSDEIHVDVRVLAASSKDLNQAVKTGEFRDALFQRLNVVPVFLPPLRDRREDIPLLAQAMIQKLSGGVKHFEPDALASLAMRAWRGNVRELKNVIERISIFASKHAIGAEDLHLLGLDADAATSSRTVSFLHDLLASNDNDTNLAEYLEQELIKLALRESSDNVSEAARRIGLDRKAFQRRLEKFGM